ncbi:hypothetical protein [Mucilaginibacter phyllosphaerae]|uniref:Uncharacterized protein n=1 Tax=Mucilaginibacter phyllosphaerae TaxID=1812349 RepID=A0A4Y8A5T6_9SPHI|nr:hypothetical protein [Mucilaginibacter phyllosphaerae]MBB3971031.1 hypothetical protein [Mucilaginibacter phyllosphaerae]TEW63773.1 hypothetical protein E2R65_18565 [Mucilaginibacter phyllosphaerae]GGH22069.1 hypothetical protein GCM10007352_35150 [Mucilaginibacter phyllosphaerae]
MGSFIPRQAWAQPSWITLACRRAGLRNTGGATVTLKQEFIITDHQGNARISFEDSGTGTAKVVQENSYYAYGMSMTSTMALPTAPNKNLYNGGSEWQNDFAD